MQKKALITGASSGIGKGIAYALAKEGYDLVCSHYQDVENATNVKRDIEQTYSVACTFFEGDLAEETFPRVLFDQALETLGHIDVLVNNAGRTIMESVLETKVESLNLLFGLNYRAPYLLTQYASQHMIEEGIQGSIVHTASTRGIQGYPRDGVYGGLKAALIRSTKSMALDLAPYGIRVNCVAPGAIQVRHNDATNHFYKQLGKRIPLGRAGTPDDIAQAVTWLVSDKAAYVTGIVIPVDGGLILPGMPERVPDGYDDYGWGNVPCKP
ncbi:NAD(P)-dependent dehydrogenase (short-subunit alcohol dehydrogenase family) [Pullulanibacillus pueri]|uniref:3-ketoacyl-ACP reductase n=1 Tax=Pullulanibacillus pueri TaxID=1437324 RepID=A0A8J3EM15_9BACL|nr:SDR family oxidoreductase [Pullulanibacillus pueri]MBM7681390.1 NAD(P)-dependent dehydrogenase (short-subunit alcohol dehydrogenase family) [Pullulanibacillus pueri]GGH78690.1 3-ketoacyl-ACP reductase [Pullulanibacillus pueri]